MFIYYTFCWGRFFAIKIPVSYVVSKRKIFHSWRHCQSRLSGINYAKYFVRLCASFQTRRECWGTFPPLTAMGGSGREISSLGCWNTYIWHWRIDIIFVWWRHGKNVSVHRQQCKCQTLLQALHALVQMLKVQIAKSSVCHFLYIHVWLFEMCAFNKFMNALIAN